MPISLSNRIAQIKPSATMAVNAKAQELKRQGIDVINLSVGEPDFPTPQVIKQAAIDAINNDITYYSAAEGFIELRQAIVDKLKRDNDLTYTTKEILVTVGAKQALYNATQALLNEGDEAIIPAPFWVSYEAMVELAGGKPVIVVSDHTQHFKITAQQLEEAITPKTKVFFLNSPSNPTGMVYSAEELKALGKVLAKYPDITIIADDIYEYILWGSKKFYTFLNACPDLKDRTIIVNGVSKAYSMTGWRVGYSAAPEAITKAMANLESQSTSSTSSISQMAAIAALKMPYSDLQGMYQTFHKRHDLLIEGLNQIDGMETQPADGAFYVYPYVQPIIEKLGLKDDIELATYLLDKAHVATVPGIAFGTPGYLRLSCSTNEANLIEAIKRLQKTL